MTTPQIGYTQESDAALKELCGKHARPLDVDRFERGLQARLASAKKRERRRPVVRRLSLAAVGLVLAAGVGVGAWQAVEHLRQPNDTLVLSDAVESMDSQGSGLGWLSLQVPRSVSEFRLADLWEEVATRLGVDPSTASLRFIQIDWDKDGLLSILQVQAGTPDGRDITMSAFAEPGTDAQQIEVRGSTSPSLLGTASERALRPGSPSFKETVFVGVDAFLSALDGPGLMEIAAQSGLDIYSDPAESFQTKPTDGYSLPGAELPAGQTINRVVISFQWMSQGGEQILASAEELTALEGQGAALPFVFLSIDGEGVTSMDADQLASVRFPALAFGLARSWSATDSTGQGSYSGLGGAGSVYALLPWVDEGADDKTIAAQPIDDRLDGLAFTTPTRDVCRIQGGAIETLWKCDEDPITAIMHPSASYGASYSLGRTLVLRGGGVVQTTTGPPDAGGSSESTSGVTDVAATAIPVGDPGASWELRTFPRDGGQWLPAMNRVVFDESGDRLWLGGISYSADATNGISVQQFLQTAQPHTAALAALPLGHPFAGDFAVSPDGNTIVYIGFAGTDAAVTLRTGDVEKELSLGLATAYHPVFSPDGSKICLVGSKNVDGDTGLWLCDLNSGDCRQIKSTAGLTPTYPAFSPDGRRLAFRDFKLGDIWTVTVEGKELTRYALTTEEAPIAW